MHQPAAVNGSEELAHLGEPKLVFRTNRKTLFWGFLVAALLCGLGIAVLIVVVSMVTADWSKDVFGCVVFLGVGILLLWGGRVLGTKTNRLRHAQVVVHVGGLSYRKDNICMTCRWDQIEEVRWRVSDHYEETVAVGLIPIPRGTTTPSFSHTTNQLTVRRKDGIQLIFTDELQNVVGLALAIQQETSRPKTAKEYLERAGLACERGDWDRAIADFTDAIRLDPKKAFGFGGRGRACYHRGLYDKAIADLSEAIRLNPQLSDLFYWRGKSYNEKGEFEKAIPDFTEAIRLDPEHDDYKDRAFAYIGLGEYDKAIADCTEAIRLKPGFAADAYYNRGIAHSGKRDNDRAIADFSEVIRHHPENFVRYADGTTNTWLNPVVKHAYRIRGFAYVDKGQYDKAIPDFTEAIRLNPNDADAYAVRAKAYRAVGEDAKAASDEWRAQELRPRP